LKNAVSARELRAMMHVLADTVIAQQRRRLHGRAARITIDLDPTDDPTHGQQEFAFFNGHYDTWCYLPVVATATFTMNPLFAPAGYGWRRCPGRRSRGRGGRRYVAAQRDAIRSGNARRMVNP
jgi:Transposase DDE domain group 1